MLKFLVMIALAGLAGVLSANYVVQGRAGLIKQSSGQWLWWPNAGSAAIDPYTRFHFLSQRRLPMSKFETFEVETAVDDAGQPLSTDCVYEVTGKVPDTRWWSLASYVPNEPDVQPQSDNVLTANDAVAEADGSIVVTISSDVSTGNWLRPSGDDEFTLVLRLYNPVNGLGSAAALSSDMPSVMRRSCR